MPFTGYCLDYGNVVWVSVGIIVMTVILTLFGVWLTSDAQKASNKLCVLPVMPMEARTNTIVTPDSMQTTPTSTFTSSTSSTTPIPATMDRFIDKMTRQNTDNIGREIGYIETYPPIPVFAPPLTPVSRGPHRMPVDTTPPPLDVHGNPIIEWGGPDVIHFKPASPSQPVIPQYPDPVFMLTPNLSTLHHRKPTTPTSSRRPGVDAHGCHVSGGQVWWPQANRCIQVETPVTPLSIKPFSENDVARSYSAPF